MVVTDQLSEEEIQKRAEEAKRDAGEEDPKSSDAGPSSDATDTEDPEASAEHEAIMNERLDLSIRGELNDLFLEIENVCGRHAGYAKAAKRHTVCHDFNALLSVARQLRKRVESVEYWKEVR